MASIPEPPPASLDPEILAQGEGWEHWQCGKARWWVVTFREGCYLRSRSSLERQLRRGTEPVVFLIPRLKDLDNPSLNGLLMCVDAAQKSNRWIGLVGRHATVKVKLVLKMLGTPCPTLREFTCLEAAEAALIRHGRALSDGRKKAP